MMNNISWESYCYALSFLLIIYYIVIGSKNYKSEIKEFLSGSANRRNNPLHAMQPAAVGPLESKSELNTLSSLLDEIAAYFKQASFTTVGKEEILYALQLITQKYPEIMQSSYGNLIRSYCVTECEANCSVSLRGSELSGVGLG